MFNFHIIKVTLKNKEVRYGVIITRSGKSIKSKTFRRKVDAKTYGSRIKEKRDVTLFFKYLGYCESFISIQEVKGKIRPRVNW